MKVLVLGRRAVFSDGWFSFSAFGASVLWRHPPRSPREFEAPDHISATALAELRLARNGLRVV